MTKHTQGPWEIKIADNGDYGITAYRTGVFIESFVDIRHPKENSSSAALANARLIAAAPELLEALINLVNLDQRCGWHSKQQDEAMAAIRKATTV